MTIPQKIPFDFSNPSRKGKTIKAYGIDLGTSNSSISVASVMPEDLGHPIITSIEIAQPTLKGVHVDSVVPSVVALLDGHLFVGQGAKKLRARIGNHAGGLQAMRDVFWDCKNHMGRNHVFHGAPDGFEMPKDIAAHILRFLANQGIGEPYDTVRTVVTVPASFGPDQRSETLWACTDAGLGADENELLDEPLAAFLGYLHEKGFAEFQHSGPVPCNLLVFDFGGGTCDIAIFQIGLDRLNGMTSSSLGVSRYLRLGGGDIDLAIVHEILMPALCEQNGLDLLDLSYEDKKTRIEPALINVAEFMKTTICDAIRTMLRNGQRIDMENTMQVDAVHTLTIGSGTVLKLRLPSVSIEQFDSLLDPFFDTDLLYPQDNEYRMTCSIFAPITDVLERTGLKPEDIHHVLLAGGSSRIPRAQEELNVFFPKAVIHTFDERGDGLTAVSRGAALQALSLQVCGRGLIQPTSGGSVYIKTNSGPVELVKRNTVLPSPGKDAWAAMNDLSVPETSLSGPLDMRVHFVNDLGEDLGVQAWEVEPPVVKGQPLRLEYRMDGNQIFEARLSVLDDNGKRTMCCEIENPHVRVCNPGALRDEIEELEDSYRAIREPSGGSIDTLRRLIPLYEKIGHREKALDACRSVLRRSNGTDLGMLNKMGLIYGDCGDHDKEIETLSKAAEQGCEPAMFNLALRRHKRREYDDAIQSLDQADHGRNYGPNLALRAVIARDMGDEDGRTAYGARALSAFGVLESLDDWELHWFRTVAELAGETALVERIQEERKRRAAPSKEDVTGVLPDYFGAPARTASHARHGELERGRDDAREEI